MSDWDCVFKLLAMQLQRSAVITQYVEGMYCVINLARAHEHVVLNSDDTLKQKNVL